MLENTKNKQTEKNVKSFDIKVIQRILLSDFLMLKQTNEFVLFVKLEFNECFI